MTTLRMFRVRGKRFWYILFAAAVTLLIFRYGKDNEHVREFDFAQSEVGDFDTGTVEKYIPDVIVAEEDGPELEVEEVKPKAKEVLQTPVVEDIKVPVATNAPAATASPRLLDKRPPTDINGIPESNEYLRSSNPDGRLEVPSISISSTIHWKRQTEHFPVPTESLIQLPTGNPVAIPTIQFKFADETTDEKISREKRQSKVKAEFEKAWKGYKTKAWMHDEVSPVSGNFRDPFCGWAASLVDGLDTLYIMGFVPEFEEAVKAVGRMDFTTSVRDDIPMFETTIRYLGGLLAAYDVSAHKYKVLLDKAVELADVMIGAFDTPNRMPVLYYHWKPAFASQKKRASYNSNTAELGSLSMEFTRLAQLTKEPRYYDAVARVTNALSQWQDRGTPLDGVFPEAIDASGCNRTMEPSLPKVPSKTTKADSGAQPLGYQPLEEEHDASSSSGKGGSADDDTVEIEILPGNPSKARIVESQAKPGSALNKRDAPPQDVKLDAEEAKAALASLNLDTSSYSSRTAIDDDCRPQGLESASTGSMRFSMGGGQDSTYEYFTKQHLLLGGHEKKYSKMYLKTIEAVRKHMLYKPMIPGDKDILFSGLITKGGYTGQLEPVVPEVEHLTCFIGGMIGMGAKVFDLEGDLELAKKLTDGCVWAYSAFPAGVMPEGSTVAVCKDPKNCQYSDKDYRLRLDPIGPSRDEEVEKYLERKKQAKLEKEQAAREETVAAQREADTASKAAADASKSSGSDALKADLTASIPKENTIGSALLEKDQPVSLQKRALGDDLAALQPKPAAAEKPQQAANAATAKSETAASTNQQLPVKKPTGSDGSSTASVAKTNKVPSASDAKEDEELAYLDKDEEVATGRDTASSQKPLGGPIPTSEETEVDPALPFTHKQITDTMIERDNLPPGFLTIRDHRYILRPEAIESVWYMYRITGDKSWQEKGWKMFEAIIAATSAPYGHSAIYDVGVAKPMQIDQMESFWLAETLKYFYLLFSTPDVVSLDDWVLNTEAHPFRRPGNEVKSGTAASAAQ